MDQSRGFQVLCSACKWFRALPVDGAPVVHIGDLATVLTAPSAECLIEEGQLRFLEVLVRKPRNLGHAFGET